MFDLKHLVKISCLLSLVVTTAHSEVYIDPQEPWSWRGYALAEQISDMKGGVKTGTIFTEAACVTAFYNTEVAGWWRGGEFALGILGIAQTHKQNLYTGAIQPPSGYSGVPEVRFNDLAYKQKIGDYFMMRAGIMDIDDYFNLTEVAFPLLNSGLTNTASLNYNTQLATYPFPGFGAFARFGTEKLFVMGGVFQGNPQHQGSVFHHGQLVIFEGDAFWTAKNIDYIGKIGLWENQIPSKDYGFSTYGAYGIAQATWHTATRKLQAGINGGFNPKKHETVARSLAACFIVHSFFKIRPKDSLNFAIGRAWLQGAPHPETYYEIGYSIRLLPDWTLTPDIQYFTHPGGVYENAWVGLMRLTYILPTNWHWRKHMRLPG